MTVTAIYFGHSHTGAIFHALQARRESGLASPIEHRPYNVWRHDLNVHFVVDEDGQRIFNPRIIDEIGGIERPEGQVIVAALFGGNAHNVLGLLQADPDFDFVLRSSAEGYRIAQGAVVLPTELVRDQLLRGEAAFLEQLTVLSQTTKCRIVQIQSPPPIEDDDFIRTNLDKHFENRDQKIRITRPELRKKLWQMSSSIIEYHCREIGIDILPSPLEAVNERGYLREEYWGNATHANGRYGELILLQIEQVAAQ